MTDKTEDPVVTFENDFDVPDFDETIADPAIRADYREALGRFIMAHNEVDFWMTGILSKAVKMLALDGSLGSGLLWLPPVMQEGFDLLNW